MTRVEICVGVGGVGKTTTAAALGLGLALSGERVVVLTIDPARRLADALGLQGLGNRPQPVSLAPLGYPGPGQLDALMLDRKATWDEVLRRFSPNAETSERLLANRYYQAISTRLTGSHEYMATEKLYDLVADGRWDVVVVDTPPAQHTIEFFRAPERVRRVLDQRVLEVLIQPGRGVLSSATRRVVDLVKGLAGDSVMEDISEFFTLISGFSSGVRERHQDVHDLLHSDRTEFFLVTSAANPRRDDVLDFLTTLREREMRFGGFFVNRALIAPELSTSASPTDLPPGPPGVGDDSWRTWLEALLHLADCQIQAAQDQRSAMSALSSAAEGAPVWAVPELSHGVRTLEGLARLARHLPPTDPPTLEHDSMASSPPMAMVAGGVPVGVDERACPEV